MHWRASRVCAPTRNADDCGTREEGAGLKGSQTRTGSQPFIPILARTVAVCACLPPRRPPMRPETRAEISRRRAMKLRVCKNRADCVTLFCLMSPITYSPSGEINAKFVRFALTSNPRLGPSPGHCDVKRPVRRFMESGCRLRSGTRRSQGIQVEFHCAGAGWIVPGSIQPAR